MKKIIIGVIILLVIVLGLFYYSRLDSEATNVANVANLEPIPAACEQFAGDATGAAWEECAAYLEGTLDASSQVYDAEVIRLREQVRVLMEQISALSQ